MKTVCRARFSRAGIVRVASRTLRWSPIPHRFFATHFRQMIPSLLSGRTYFTIKSTTRTRSPLDSASGLRLTSSRSTRQTAPSTVSNAPWKPLAPNFCNTSSIPIAPAPVNQRWRNKRARLNASQHLVVHRLVLYRAWDRRQQTVHAEARTEFRALASAIHRIIAHRPAAQPKALCVFIHPIGKRQCCSYFEDSAR